MSDAPAAAAALGVIRERAPGFSPRVGIVLGSGLAGLAAAVSEAIIIPYSALPGFPPAGVSGHGRDLVLGRLCGCPVAVMTGRAHYYEHGNAAMMRPAIETLAGLGAEGLLLTNAAGSLRPACGPGSLMLIADHIAFGPNPLIGEAGDRRFVDLTEAYDPAWRAGLKAAAEAAGIALEEGVYMWFSGPSFETPAEIRMAGRLGADAVGMSTVPEVILARYVGLKVAAVSMITNLAAGLSAEPLSHEATKDRARRGAANLARLIETFLDRLATRRA